MGQERVTINKDYAQRIWKILNLIRLVENN